jgi:hypothetical protein
MKRVLEMGLRLVEGGSSAFGCGGDEQRTGRVVNHDINSTLI